MIPSREPRGVPASVEERLLKRGEELSAKLDEMEDVDEIDDLPETEAESAEQQVVDQATAARTIAAPYARSPSRLNGIRLRSALGRGACG